MSMEYIRKAYQVPAFRGQKVSFRGQEGQIIGSRNAYLRVRLASGRVVTLHPTWELSYGNTASDALPE